MPNRLLTLRCSAARTRVRRGRVAVSVVGAVLTFLGADRAGAQAWIYPSFQQSHMVNREFTVGIADGGYDGTSYIFQWREELAPRNEFIFNGGVATGVDGHSLAFLGALYGYQVLQQRDSEPFEVLATGGLGLAFGHGGTYTQVPIAASLGHRFAFSSTVALTPYVHPGVSLDFCNHCVADVRGGTDRAGVGAVFGVGANLELAPRFSVRIEGSIDASSIGPQANTIGFGVAWSPAALFRP